jgi:hypothetical protein
MYVVSLSQACGIYDILPALKKIMVPESSHGKMLFITILKNRNLKKLK